MGPQLALQVLVPVVVCRKLRPLQQVLQRHTLFAGLLARSQYPEGPATGHLGIGFSWFPCVYKRMMRWFSRLVFLSLCETATR